MTRVVVIGGGIAGLSAALRLAGGRHHVTLVEREPILCAHSSGRNAAIFRHAEPSPLLIDLARKSRALVDDLLGDGDWLQPVGALYGARHEDALARLVQAAAEASLDTERLAGNAIAARAPALAGGSIRAGLFSPGDGIIDIHRVTTTLAARVRAAGVDVRCGRSVEHLEKTGGAVTGAHLDDGQYLAADVVVNAAGAWARTVGANAGADRPLTPLRRHLALLDAKAGHDHADHPVVWRVDDDDEVYFRPEGNGLLASPCDETPWAPCVPVRDDATLLPLAEKLADVAPALQAQSRVRRLWACLRTFAPDRGLVVGPDPDVAGLFWIAGLGGHGMTLGLAAAAALADHVDQGAALDAALLPARLARGPSPEVMALAS